MGTLGPIVAIVRIEKVLDEHRIARQATVGQIPGEGRAVDTSRRLGFEPQLPIGPINKDYIRCIRTPARRHEEAVDNRRDGEPLRRLHHCATRRRIRCIDPNVVLC